jgi:hypothetical protein
MKELTWIIWFDLLIHIHQSIKITQKQCCRSGAGSAGSLCFFTWIRNQIHFTQVARSESGFFHQAKIVRKTLIPTVFWLILDFLSSKNDVNEPSKSNKQENFFTEIVFCWHLEVQWRKQQDPDPLVRGMDPRIRITRNGSGTLKHGLKYLLLEFKIYWEGGWSDRGRPNQLV